MMDFPPWLTLWIGLIVVAVVLNYAHKFDQWLRMRANPNGDSRKSSVWLWVLMIGMIGGGLFWIGSQPGGGGGGDYDPWEFARGP